MDIFITDINIMNKKTLNSFIDNNKGKITFKNEIKQQQHYVGQFLFQYAAQNIYNINNPQLEFINNKPFIKNNIMYLSISHSKNIVVVAFEKFLIGIDIEYNKKERDFLKIAKKSFSKENYLILKDLPQSEQKKYFYELWTRYEANIKLGSNENKRFYLTDYFIKDFTFSCASEKEISIDNVKYLSM